MSTNDTPVSQLLAFQATEISRAESRMQKACAARQMKPETMDHLLRNMRAVHRALQRLANHEAQAIKDLAAFDQAHAASQPPAHTA